MNLIELKCPNCGARLEQEWRTFKFNCEFCRSAFLLTDDDNTLVKYDYDDHDLEY